MSAAPGNDGRKVVLAGGCQCGRLRYALYSVPAGVHICHCRMCQKAVGGPFAALAPVPAADFAWTRGTPGTFDSSSIAARDFCRDCGTPLTYRGLSGRVNVSAGSLDDPSAVRPDFNLGVESRLAWLADLAHIPDRTTDQDFPPDVLAAIVSHQHPDEETGENWKPAGTQAR
ncbi:MAG: GFA family protein [Hyphomicrobiaceae bacterium]